MSPSSPEPTALGHVQLALDVVTRGDASLLTALVADQVERLEVGTPLVLAEGLATLALLHEIVPGAELVADVKICDAGERIARTAFAAGADAITVVAAAIDGTTWRGVLAAAAAHAAAGHTATVIVDTIGPRIDRDALAGLAAVAAATAPGVRVELCIHRPKSHSPSLAALRDELGGAADGFAGLGIAGRLAPHDVAPALAAGFTTLVVGSAVAEAVDPRAALLTFARPS